MACLLSDLSALGLFETITGPRLLRSFDTQEVLLVAGCAVSAGAAARGGVLHTTSWPRSISAAADTEQTPRHRHVTDRLTHTCAHSPKIIPRDQQSALRQYLRHNAGVSTRGEHALGLTCPLPSFRGSGRPVERHVQAVSG